MSEMPNLQYLAAYETGLSTIDVSGLTLLSTFHVYGCPDLTTIIADGCTSLKEISSLYDDDYYFPSLTTISLKGCTAMTSFTVRGKKVESVDLSDCTGLTSLSASNREHLTSLVYDGCTALKSLSLSKNALQTAIDVSVLPALESLTVSELPLLESVEVGEGKSLKTVRITENPLLETLTVKSPTLTSLNCSSNSLKTLDITQCPELTHLNCMYNLLTSLDLSKNTKLTSTSTDQYDLKVEMVYLSATEVGFAVNESFKAANVVRFRINSEDKEPKYATVDGMQYFVVYDNAAEAEEYLKNKTLKYGYDTGLAGHTLNNTLTITGYTKAPSFLKVNPDSVTGVYGAALAAPELIRSQAYEGEVTYVSGNEAVVKVAADGQLTVIGAGETTITISGVETDYRVAPADVVYPVVIEKASPVFKFEKAEQEMLILDEVPANAFDKGVYDGTVVYKTSDEKVATIAADGKVTVVAAGEVTFTAEGEATNNCNKPTAASYKLVIKKRTATLTLSAESVEGVFGGKVTAPKATITEGYDSTLTYTSSNKNVVKVSSTGKLTIKGAGEATITVSAPETANYYAPASVSYNVTITKASPTFAFAEEALEVVITDEVPENKLDVGVYDGTVVYSSSDTTIAEVNAETGIVTMKKIGEVTITATGAETANCNAASASYTLTITPMPGDVNADMAIDVADVLATLNLIANNGYNKFADLNKDDKVDIADVQALLDLIARKDAE